MSEVHRSVYFTVGSLSADDSQPEVWLENSGSCPVSRNNTALCGNYHWHLEIHIQVPFCPTGPFMILEPDSGDQ